MRRRLPIAAGTLVTTIVFAWLAAPLLAATLGTVALIVTYATVALAAGGLTFVLVDGLLDILSDPERDAVELSETEDEPADAGATTDPIVERELFRLSEELGKN